MVNGRETLDLHAFEAPPGHAVAWRIAEQPVAYPEAVAAMETRAAAIASGDAPELVWLLEHPPLYTSGTSGRTTDLLDSRFPLFATGRGGQVTYHGPGQRVAYTMLDLRERGRDIRALVRGLEGWIIDTLAQFNVVGERRDGRIGVWVRRPYKGPGCEDKIAAIGVRVSRWVSFHGISLNVSPDLSHARVNFTHFAGREHGDAAVKALSRTAGFLRSQLSHRLNLYSVPELHFTYDDSIEHGMKLSRLIDDAVAADKRNK